MTKGAVKVNSKIVWGYWAIKTLVGDVTGRKICLQTDSVQTWGALVSIACVVAEVTSAEMWLRNTSPVLLIPIGVVTVVCVVQWRKRQVFFLLHCLLNSKAACRTSWTGAVPGLSVWQQFTSTKLTLDICCLFCRKKRNMAAGGNLKEQERKWRVFNGTVWNIQTKILCGSEKLVVWTCSFGNIIQLLLSAVHLFFQSNRNQQKNYCCPV